MLRYVLRRFLLLIPMVLAASVIIFLMLRLGTGDPALDYLRLSNLPPTPEMLASTRTMLGLDQPLMQQYVRWAQNVLRGDWGISFKYKQPVITVIANMWVNTLILGGISIVLTFVLAIAIGKFCTLHEGSLADRMICKAGTISSCIPTFFL